MVGQLQMRGDTLVTGGSDGSVRVWSLERLVPIHRLAAHDNSVTSLQFNESRIVSGGSDGRVKVWDTKAGTLVRELSQPADAVWRVVFEEEKAIILANRANRTIMEVCLPLLCNMNVKLNVTPGLVILSSGRSYQRPPASVFQQPHYWLWLRITADRVRGCGNGGCDRARKPTCTAQPPLQEAAPCAAASSP